MNYRHLPGNLDLVADPIVALMEMLLERVAAQRRALHQKARPKVGAALRPGAETPLWNALVDEIRPHLKKYGDQTKLARLLGLDRQTVNAYFTSKTRMPDAERTLQLLVWLLAVRQGRPPF